MLGHRGKRYWKGLGRAALLNYVTVVGFEVSDGQVRPVDLDVESSATSPAHVCMCAAIIPMD